MLKSLMDCKEIQPVHSKGDQSWVFFQGMMLKLKLQYFGHLMRRVDSLEKTVMLIPQWISAMNPLLCCNFPPVSDCLLKRSKREIPGVVQFSSVQSLSRVPLFATPWITARQASLSITNSQSSLKLTSIKSVMPSSPLILCRPLLLLPPIPPSISLFQWVNSSHEVAKVLEFQL